MVRNYRIRGQSMGGRDLELPTNSDFNTSLESSKQAFLCSLTGSKPGQKHLKIRRWYPPIG